jgi:ParB family chromosome partitioning protein
MGRGLAAILPTDGESTEPAFRELPLDMVVPNPDQPRKRFDAESIAALAVSIGETGVIQPLIVRPLADGRFELIAGERRWRAARDAGLDSVPAVIRDERERERLQTALIENMAREDLNPVDAARACAALVEDLGVTREQVARRVGRSRPAISNLIRLLDLPDDTLALLESGELSEGHGRAILTARGNDVRRRLAREAARAGWSVRETERRAKAPARRNGKVAPHPDQQAVLSRAEDELSAALGREVRVRAAPHGIRAELQFDDLDDALRFARSERRRRAG